MINSLFRISELFLTFATFSLFSLSLCSLLRDLKSFYGELHVDRERRAAPRESRPCWASQLA